MILWRTVLGSFVILAFMALVIYGSIAKVEVPVTAMIPVVAPASGFLFGFDAIQLLLRRKEAQRNGTT